MMNRVISYMIVLTLLVTGCSLLNRERQEEPVARVFEQYLYPSDISDAIPGGSSAQDSMILAERYIDTWVKDQLLLHRAEQELTEDQKDFQKQMEEYYRSFLIYTYRVCPGFRQTKSTRWQPTTVAPLPPMFCVMPSRARGSWFAPAWPLNCWTASTIW